MSNLDPLILDVIEVKDLKSLKDNQEIELNHPLIQHLTIKVRKDYRVESVIGVPVTFYGANFIVEEEYPGVTFSRRHEVLLNSQEMVSYIKRLLTCRTKPLHDLVRNMQEKGVFENDVIEFENGNRGVIFYSELMDASVRNVQYVPLKKDGTLSKVKPRLIYAGDKYQKIGRFEG